MSEDLIAMCRKAKLPRYMYDTPAAREALARLLSLRPEASRISVEPAPNRPIWDGIITFHNDAIVNGVFIKAGTVWKAGEPLPQGDV